MTLLSPPVNYDYALIKFAKLKKPVGMAWTEIGSGRFIPEESSDEQFVFVTEKAATRDTESTPSKTVVSKVDFIKYLQSVLTDANVADPEVVNYGEVQDVRIQPAGQEITRSVFQFLSSFE